MPFLPSALMNAVLEALHRLSYGKGGKGETATNTLLFAGCLDGGQRAKEWTESFCLRHQHNIGVEASGKHRRSLPSMCYLFLWER